MLARTDFMTDTGKPNDLKQVNPDLREAART